MTQKAATVCAHGQKKKKKQKLHATLTKLTWFALRYHRIKIKTDKCVCSPLCLCFLHFVCSFIKFLLKDPTGLLKYRVRVIFNLLDLLFSASGEGLRSRSSSCGPTCRFLPPTPQTPVRSTAFSSKVHSTVFFFFYIRTLHFTLELESSQ